MIALALLASVVAQAAPQDRRPQVAVQATATVRILPGARITATETPHSALVRNARIKSADGSEETVKLIEFP